jgi:hypothetical protein
MAKTMGTRGDRSADHLAQYRFGKGAPPADRNANLSGSDRSLGLPSGRGVEQPAGGKRMSKSCGIHSDADIPPLQR